jgi:hypothetical protein
MPLISPSHASISVLPIEPDVSTPTTTHSVPKPDRPGT